MRCRGSVHIHTCIVKVDRVDQDFITNSELVTSKMVPVGRECGAACSRVWGEDTYRSEPCRVLQSKYV